MSHGRREVYPAEVRAFPCTVPAKAGPDLDALLHRLGQSIALVAVAQRSLESQELVGTGQEAAVLEAGIAVLNEVYNDLDAAAGQLWRAAR